MSLKVVGIIENMPFRKSFTGTIYTDPDILKNRFQINMLNEIQIQITDTGHLKKDQTEVQIEKILQKYSADTILYNRDEEKQKLQQEFLQRMILLAISVSVMTGIAVLGLMNVAASSLRERSREFALLRAIGGGKRQLFCLALMEGSIVATAGCILGSVACLGLGLHVAQAMGSVSLFRLEWSLYPVLLGPLLGLAATVLPSFWVSRLDVVKTMQHY